MKRNSVIVMMVCFFFLIFTPMVYAEDDIPDSKEEAIDKEMEKLEQTVDEPGVYTVVIQYMVDGQIMEQTINLRIVETPIETVYQNNTSHFQTKVYHAQEDDFWNFNSSTLMMIVRFFLMIFVIILVIVFLIQFVSVELLLKEISNLFNKN
ncbi:MAG: hypothetical protein ACK5LC_13995 [Coprobacillaceae bacterium]